MLLAVFSAQRKASCHFEINASPENVAVTRRIVVERNAGRAKSHIRQKAVKVITNARFHQEVIKLYGFAVRARRDASMSQFGTNNNLTVVDLIADMQTGADKIQVKLLVLVIQDYFGRTFFILDTGIKAPQSWSDPVDPMAVGDA